MRVCRVSSLKKRDSMVVMNVSQFGAMMMI